MILLWGGRLIKNQEPHLGAESWVGSLLWKREANAGLLREEVLGESWKRGFLEIEVLGEEESWQGKVLREGCPKEEGLGEGFLGRRVL